MAIEGKIAFTNGKTDNLGFKNIEIKKNYEFIFLGNSYVEGLCAAIDETASYYLTKKKYTNI